MPRPSAPPRPTESWCPAIIFCRAIELAKVLHDQPEFSEFSRFPEGDLQALRLFHAINPDCLVFPGADVVTGKRGSRAAANRLAGGSSSARPGWLRAVDTAQLPAATKTVIRLIGRGLLDPIDAPIEGWYLQKILEWTCCKLWEGFNVVEKHGVRPPLCHARSVWSWPGRPDNPPPRSAQRPPPLGVDNWQVTKLWFESIDGSGELPTQFGRLSCRYAAPVGEAGHEIHISSGDCLSTQYALPAICPKALTHERQDDPTFLAALSQIEEFFRQDGLLRPGFTLRWLGDRRLPGTDQNACHCSCLTAPACPTEVSPYLQGLKDLRGILLQILYWGQHSWGSRLSVSAGRIPLLGFLPTGRWLSHELKRLRTLAQRAAEACQFDLPNQAAAIPPWVESPHHEYANTEFSLWADPWRNVLLTVILQLQATVREILPCLQELGPPGEDVWTELATAPANTPPDFAAAYEAVAAALSRAVAAWRTPPPSAKGFAEAAGSLSVAIRDAKQRYDAAEIWLRVDRELPEHSAHQAALDIARCVQGAMVRPATESDAFFGGATRIRAVVMPDVPSLLNAMRDEVARAAVARLASNHPPRLSSPNATPANDAARVQGKSSLVPAIVLGHRWSIIRGQEIKIKLKREQRKVLAALIEAGEPGLPLKRLIRVSGLSSAHKILKAIRELHPLFAETIEMSGRAKQGYRIRHDPA